MKKIWECQSNIILTISVLATKRIAFILLQGVLGVYGYFLRFKHPKQLTLNKQSIIRKAILVEYSSTA